MTAETARPAPGTGQRLLIPAYFYPRGSQWQEMCDALAGRGLDAVIVVNPASGPGAAVDPVYTDVLRSCRSAGQTVIGYVDTEFSGRKLASVRADIDDFYRLYPAIEGIFLDQVSNEPRRRVKRYYRDLYRDIKSARPEALVIGNPGVPALTPWQVRGGGIADVLCVFEMPAAGYASWTPPPWVASSDPRRFAHLVYATGDPETTAAVALATREKGAGWLYVTQGVMPNPWDLPPEPALVEHPGLERRAVAAT